MACCGKAAYEKNEAPNRKHITHQHAAISHTWCKNAKRPWQNLVLPRPLFPCPICAQRRPRITKSSGLCSRAQTIKIKSTPRAASCLLMGSRPQWPPFGAKPRNCKYSYGVSPGFPPGSFYPRATQRSGKGEDDTMYAFISTKYHAGLQLSMPFFLPAAFSRCPPKNPHREEPPPAPGAEGGVGAGFGPHPVERK